MNKFKRWYSAPEAAALLRQMMVEKEPVTERDVLDRINDGELPAWFNATGHYAVEVYPGCLYYSDPARNPHFPLIGNLQGEELALWRRSSEGLLDGSDTVQVLTGRYRLANFQRMDVIFLPGPGEQKASLYFADGFLVYDDDGETILKIVRRIPGANPASRDVSNFVAGIEAPFPSADLLIASEDLLAMIAPPAMMGTGERDTLLRQIGALALLLSERASVYKRGGKPNATQISAAVAKIVAEVPEAKTHGLGAVNLRNNISAGLSLLRREENS